MQKEKNEMEKIENITIWTKLYVFIVVLYIFRVYDVTWTDKIPAAFVWSLAAIAAVIKMVNNSKYFYSSRLIPILILFVYCFYLIIVPYYNEHFAVFRLADRKSVV